MNRLITASSVAALAWLAMADREVNAQALQLPSFHVFTVNTTVSVPDRGAAYLGGVSRAASGSVGRGIPLFGKAPGLGRLGRNGAIGSEGSSSGVSVSATIIDHRELDAAVLAAARRLRSERGEPAVNADMAESRAVATDVPVASVADILRDHERADETRRQEALALIAKGRAAEAEGKAKVARLYYDMAARRADPTLRQKIAAHVAAMPLADARTASRIP